MATTLSRYVMVSVGLMILMSLAGLQTSMGWILSQLGINLSNVQNFSSGYFMGIILAAITSLVAVSGIRIGVFGAATQTTFAAALLALPMALMIGDLVSIVVLANSTAPSWISYIAFLIVVPFLFGYAITLFDWVRGMP